MAEATADFPLLTVLGSVLTDDECARIVDVGERLPAIAGRVNDPNAADGQHAVRDTTVRNLAPDADFGWVYQRLVQQASLHNQQALGFELESSETLQLLSYGPGQHYDWHVDIGTDGLALRKLSLIALLSDPADYEGGELEVFFGDRPTPVIKARGALVLFPSFVLHRVRTISRGHRRSLALWLRGSQRFR